MVAKSPEELVSVLREYAQAMRNGYAEYGSKDNINGLLGMERICDGAADRVEELMRREHGQNWRG